MIENLLFQKFIKGSTCFERYTAHHQKLQTVFAASGLYTHVVTGCCPGWVRTLTQSGQRPVTTWVYKPEAANTVWNSWWWAVCHSKHVKPSINFWNNKFYYSYKFPSCWLLLLIHTTVHGSINIQFKILYISEPWWHIRYSDYATGWTVWGSSPGRGKRFFCSPATSRQALGPILPGNQWLPRRLPGGKAYRTWS
jgi:hypothetical protein